MHRSTGVAWLLRGAVPSPFSRGRSLPRRWQRSHCWQIRRADLQRSVRINLGRDCLLEVLKSTQTSSTRPSLRTETGRSNSPAWRGVMEQARGSCRFPALFPLQACVQTWFESAATSSPEANYTSRVHERSRRTLKAGATNEHESTARSPCFRPAILLNSAKETNIRAISAAGGSYARACRHSTNFYIQEQNDWTVS